MKLNILGKKKLLFFSPWLFAAALSLLALIIVVIAFSNIQREKMLMTDSLYRKGEDLIRFIGAGARASIMSGMMGGLMGRPEFNQEAHLQYLIEQASENPDIHYIAVIDKRGRIIAHSDPALAGKNLDRDTDFLQDALIPQKALNRENHHIIAHDPQPGQVFEVFTLFTPFHSQSGSFAKNWQKSRDAWPDDSSTIFILVGLDMTDLEKAGRQHLYQVISLSAALLLVGMGGWFSLLVIQGYRISQESLSRIQAFTGLLISRLPAGIVATDPDGKIRTFNQAAAAMAGKDINNALNHLPAEVLPPAIVDFYLSSINRENNPDMVEKEISLQVDNRVLSLQVSTMPVFNQEGGFMGQVLLMHDLSRLKKLEKEMRRHERLVSLGKMAAGVAHEVRNPLSSIKGFAILLGSRFKPGSSEQEAAQLMVQEVERLNRSITEFLNYARPTPLKLQQVNLRVILHKSLKLISTDAESLGIATGLEVSDSLPEISADADLLNQVLLNLYLNALQAMENVAPARKLMVTAGSGEENNTVQITVQDTGRGISKDLLAHILDPYFTTKPDGNGLGLAIADKIIDEHGGAISFASREGAGTTVTITLPVK